jgi:pimeloyl-ACP methyl ester carboxylesterase
MTERRDRRTTALIVVVGAATLLGACASDEGAADPAPSATSALDGAGSTSTTGSPTSATAADETAADETVATDPLTSDPVVSEPPGPPDVGAATRELDCAAQLPEYVESRIPDGAANPRLSCWAIDVPENYEDPDGRRIEVTYYIWESATPPAERPADPIAYAPGGPRGSAFNTLRIFPTRDVQGDRDLIMMDTRGNSPVPNDDRGIPESGCPELYDSMLSIFSTNDPIESEYQVLTDGWQRCIDRLRADGWDLDQYNTTNVIRDLEQIRASLGYDEWNFYSESYSTLYALHYMREHPDSLRAVLIDSATPPDGGTWAPSEVGAGVDAVYQAMYQGCAASPECSASYPDLAATFASAIAQLDADPHQVDVAHPLTGEVVTMSIDGQDLAFGLGELADAATLPALPGIIAAVAAGDRAIIDASAGQLLAIADGGLGLSGATVCHDYGADPDAVMNGPDDATATAPPWQHLAYMSNMPCEVVDVAPAAAGFNDPVTSSVPALVVIGQLDSATPPADSLATADALGEATVAYFDHESHVPVRSNECARALTVAFWDDLGSLDLGCVDEANARPIVFTGAP